VSALAISESGRPIVWLCRWSWYGGQTCGFNVYGTSEEAIRSAIFQAKGFVNWVNFPNQISSEDYPNDDRDGSNTSLTPLFRATWASDDGGYAEVVKCEVDNLFHAADYAEKQVDEIYQRLLAARRIQ
jgi:hypothetical protein